jgi:hypothetical protein
VASEFFERGRLQALTGQPTGRFWQVDVKELMDNALDAAESARVQPEVMLEVAESDGRLTISVSDNGPGMSAELIDQICDFGVLVSDKSAYRSPTRGLQGNGLKTVIGIPHALGGQDPIVFRSKGWRHTIHAGLDPSGVPRTPRRSRRELQRRGYSTTITVTIPAESQDQRGFRRWVRRFVLFNPHATIGYLDQSTGAQDPEMYKSTVPGRWRKWGPGDKTSIWWYDEAALARLVFGLIHKQRNTGGRDLPLGDFLKQFRDFQRPDKRAEVAALVPDIRHLSDFEDHQDAISTVLSAMQERCRPPQPPVLGRVGKEQYYSCFDAWYGVTNFRYKQVTSRVGEIPWVVEIALAETRRPGGMFYAVNFSPVYSDPLAQYRLITPEIRSTGLDSFLRQLGAHPDDHRFHRAAAIHNIAPALSFLDKGKATLAVPDEHGVLSDDDWEDLGEEEGEEEGEAEDLDGDDEDEEDEEED